MPEGTVSHGAVQSFASFMTLQIKSMHFYIFKKKKICKLPHRNKAYNKYTRLKLKDKRNIQINLMIIVLSVMELSLFKLSI